MKSDLIHPEFVIPVSYGSTEVIATGKWGFQKPESAFMTAPCQEACPAGNPIAQFLYLAGEGRTREALQAILRENPFPGVCGRVCFHPCEKDCNRGQYDESVSIQGIERHVSDAAQDVTPDRCIPSNPKAGRVAVVGAGPAGLSASYFLRLLGHEVTLFEARDELGGVMARGIPRYRLPRAVLKKDIDRILRLSIDVRKGVRVGMDVPFEELEGFDAVFLSPGAEQNLAMGITGEDLKKVWKGGDFLERINRGERIRVGKEILVVGGGNTAMDVARSALRLGSRVTVAYRRTRSEMPAVQDEVRDAEEEGARIEFLIQPLDVTLLRSKRIKVTFQRMRMRGKDRNGRRKAIRVPGEFVALESDSLVTAVGEGVDLSWVPAGLIEKGLIKPEAAYDSSEGKFFAGGDAVDQPRTIVTAVAAGKKGAISIDLYLRGLNGKEVLPGLSVGNKGSLSMEAYLLGREKGDWPGARDVVSFDKINTLFFKHSPRVEMKRLPRKAALKGFSEVNSGFSPEEAQLSASRCFSCGTCNYCYNCYFFCPEGVVSLDALRQTKEVDLDHCKGCGTCAKSCPRNAVVMKEAI